MSKFAGFGDCLLKSIHTGGLAYAGCKEHIVFSENNGIRLGVFHNDVGEEQIVNLTGIRCNLGDDLQVGGRFGVVVAFLHQHAVKSGAENFVVVAGTFLKKNDSVFLLFENIKRFLRISGSNDDFKENRIDKFGRSKVDRPVGDNYAAKGRYRVAFESVLPGLGEGGADSQTTRVVVL